MHKLAEELAQQTLILTIHTSDTSFESLHVRKQTTLIFFVMFLSTAKHKSQCYLEIGHDRFIQFTGQVKYDGTRIETRFRLSAKRTIPFKSAGESVQSTTGSRGVCISSSNAGYTMFRGSVKGTGYPLHSPVSPSLPLLRVTVCHHISTGI